MKVLVATGLYPPEIGGPATYAAMLAEELPAHDIDVVVVPFGLVRRYPRIIRHAIFVWKLWRMSKGVDLVYALDATSVGLPALIASRLRGIPFLLRVPGDYAWEQGQLRFGVTDRLHDFIEKRNEYGLPVRLLCWLESFVATRAVRVVVPSDYMKYVMEKWGVAKERVTVIYSALYPLPVDGTRDDLRAQLSYTEPTIVSAGRLVPNKGFLQLISVFAELRSEYPEAQLVIVGEGPQHNALLQQAKDFGVSESVRLVGQVSKEALGASIRAADVFVLNTAHEGLSHQLIEVMDLGVPIVTTEVGGNPELITDGVDGYLVPYDDAAALKAAIGHVLDHPESRERIVQSARGRSKLFAKEVVVGQIVEIVKAYGQDA